MGIGAWSWGDRSGYWGYGEQGLGMAATPAWRCGGQGLQLRVPHITRSSLLSSLCPWCAGKEYGKDETKEAYKALMDAGLTFIDTGLQRGQLHGCAGAGWLACPPTPSSPTLLSCPPVNPTLVPAAAAEVYGFGKSEEFLRDYMTSTATQPIIATKFAPLPWRLTAGAVPAACKASLARLGQQKMGLYIQHWPGFFFNAFSNDAYLEGLAQCYEQGLTEVGGGWRGMLLNSCHGLAEPHGGAAACTLAEC